MVKRLSENLLIAANIFILFLLVFYQHLHVPAWLQVIGRMHPLLLHFPIVLLILALILDLLTIRSEQLSASLRPLISHLWLAGALTAAITVIMGLFLSREEGYTGDMLAWHKWSGIAVVWLSSLLYWYRYVRRSVMVTGSALTLISLAVAGHFGANLTHGSDFLLAPVTPQYAKVTVPIEQAVIFEHLVKPILEQKCMSCHNSTKAKGELLMQTTAQIMKGGKSGPLFIAGNPMASLMIERLHLPMEDKKHMPPTGKTQLSLQEIEVLQHWIRLGGDFKKTVASLKKEDSLYVLAAQLLKPAVTEDAFDFAAASEESIKKLNNNYRVVFPLSRNSPALVVNFYSKEQYSPKALEELLPLKTQIVELHMQKMPVKDEELSIIKQFSNLRKINLDFSAITGSTLQELTGLKHLRSLALSGTGISLQHLQKLKASKSLEEVYCWNTPLTEKDWQQLATIKNIRFEKGYDNHGQEPLKLNAPIVNNDNTIFQSKQTLAITHPIKGVEIRYTLDGSEVDSLNSPVYKDSIIVDSSFTVKAKAFKVGWYGSDALVARFLKTTYKPDSAVLLKPANENYLAEGPKTFWDLQTGNFDIRSGKWVGFRVGEMELLMMFNQPVNVHAITLNTMRNVGAYIFPPTKVEIWGGTDPAKMQLLKKIQPVMPGKDDPNIMQGITCEFPAKDITCIKIVAAPLQKLPSWHNGKGKPAWIFIDEILVN
ncbi:cytochrome C [Chitinophaga sp. SYP-B3965]|uniref:c-type cytochrome domain-containing protein n=1 Tax=Chitinophaga sp. SYP-B3965 TaxID=2663120 RepID=UPI001299B31B|nr:c-type cytochrome domain-containing protein [Chitinophaga sp. SYP-B3965]MRG44049.1 cytochrome C [Chitinophaga sp. SYP-B3965]